MGAAILPPRRLVVSRVEGTLFAVAHCADAAAVDAECLQIFFGRVRAAIAEGQVVLLGAALVAVTFDEQVVLPVSLQPVGGGGQRRLRVGRERRLVESEEGVLDVAAALGQTVGLFDVRGQLRRGRSEERRVGKECRSRWSPY